MEDDIIYIIKKYITNILFENIFSSAEAYNVRAIIDDANASRHNGLRPLAGT